MDFLVLLEDCVERSPQSAVSPDDPLRRPFAHVNSIPSTTSYEGSPREVVTLYGAVDSQALALALAAAFEGHRVGGDTFGAIRHLGVWTELGAVGDTAWRDQVSGQVMTQDLEIPFDTLLATAHRLLDECGSAIGQMVAGLSMPDWPEGVRRAINFSLGWQGMTPLAVPTGYGSDAMLDSLREADGYDVEGD
jgi:hypothetical protein